MADFICSPVSHVFPLIEKDGRDHVLDWAPVIRLVPLDDFLAEGNTLVHVAELPQPVDISLALDWAKEGYDLLGLIGHLLARFLKRNPLAFRGKFTCASVVVALLQQAGYPGAHEWSLHSTSPGELLKKLR
jgi:hypothetical protein